MDIGIAADVGILNRINKIVGNDSLTREIAFTARDITAHEALQYGMVGWNLVINRKDTSLLSGLISRVFQSAEDCLAASISLAETIASKSPIAVQGTKLTLNYARDHTIDDSLNFIVRFFIFMSFSPYICGRVGCRWRGISRNCKATTSSKAPWRRCQKGRKKRNSPMSDNNFFSLCSILYNYWYTLHLFYTGLKLDTFLLQIEHFLNICLWIVSNLMYKCYSDI